MSDVKNLQVTLQQKLAAYQKNFRRDALNKCILCNDPLIQDPCTQECSKYYHIFKQGERMITAKYNNCTARSRDDKGRKECVNQANKDLDSLLNFAKRVESDEGTIETLLKKSE